MIDEENFYDVLRPWLQRMSVCVECGTPQWVGYSAAHMWVECQGCTRNRMVFDPAAYVLDQNVPIEPLPADIEYKQFIHPELYKSHEGLYRLKLEKA